MNLYNMTNRVNKELKWKFLGLILLGSQILLAQTGSNPSPVNYNIDVYPKTPEAAALSKFVDIPAGSYTGVADFSIPLYTIEFDGGSIPIELRYTTTGIKVGEIASRAGLGWVLNAGPSLSQQVIGVHDKTFPRPVITTNYDPTNNNDSYNIAIKTAGISNGGLSPVDIKPDIFSYSLLNASGKYILDASGTYGIPMPYNQIKITPSSYYNMMNIVDEGGFQYKFENYPGAASKNTCADENLNGLTYNDPNFKITNIKSSKGHEVKYIYGRPVSNIKYINSITTQERIRIEGEFPMTGTPHPPAPKCVNYTIMDDQALTEIQFKGGKVLFSYSNNGVRSDVNGEVYLTGIIVVNDKNETIKNFTLSYLYFESPDPVPVYGAGFSYLNDYAQGMNKRLKLVSVKDNLTNGSYHLDYYESSDDGKVLPARTSNDQDYWGVFNGAGNGIKSTPYTKYTKNGIVKIFESDYSGANKEPNINYGKLGNLSKIKYPTGGYTQIEYEADDYFSEFLNPVYDYISNGAEPLADDYYYYIFDIPENAYNKKLRFFGDYHPNNVVYEGDCSWRLHKLNTNTAIFEDYANGRGYINERNDPPGTYKLSIQPNQNGPTGCYAEYYWLNEVLVNNSHTRKAGTIRVQRIESFDNNNGKIIREYTYKEPTENHIPPYTKSSGKNLGNEVFSAVSTQRYPLDRQGKFAQETLLSNNAGWQTATVRGKPIGYDYVQEHYISENNPSKSYRKEYTFKNDIDDVWVQHNPYSPINYTWPIEGLDRGLLLEEKLFDSSNQLVKKTTKEYQFNTHFNTTATSYVGGEFLGEGLEIVPIRHLGIGTSGYQFETSTFPIKNFWITDTLTTTIDYKSATDSLTTVQKTKYSIPQYKHTYPVETTVEGSDEENIKTLYKYPQDLIGLEPNMQQLKDANRLSTPVIVESFYIEGMSYTSVSTQKTEYATYQGNSLLLPNFIYLKKGTQPFENKITYQRYDNKGNLEQYKMENGITVSIIWGYDQKYPIAKVENIEYASIPVAQLENAVTQSNTGTEASLKASLQTLREVLPETAMITTYTYKPLVGVTTMISPNGQESFYVYDDAGRLDKILDQNGHVLKKMDYHYKN